MKDLVIADRLEAGQTPRRAIISTDPNTFLIIDMYPVFALEPLVTLSVSALSLYEIASGVENNDGRRGHRHLILGKRTREVKHPYVVPHIDANTRSIAQFPFGVF